jgi:polysaccharide pyruvyl transferase WcaK-like protein
MIHHVYANQSNVGDWLSARGIQSLLAPRKVREHFCDEPFVPETIAALERATAEDFIIIGGGGLFMEYFVPFWEKFAPVARRVPFAIWGVGACDLKRERSLPPANLMTEIVQQSRLCVVRDELTREFLSGCRLPPPVICPTVVAVPPVASEAKRVLHVDHYDNVGAKIFEQMETVAQDFAKRTGRSYRKINNLISAGHNGQFRDVLEAYVSADVILSSRLHGCIIALAMGRRVLVVSGDNKVEGFMHAAGLADWVIDLDQIESLPAKLEKLPEQELPVEFIEAGRQQNRAIAKKIIALL